MVRTAPRLALRAPTICVAWARARRTPSTRAAASSLSSSLKPRRDRLGPRRIARRTHDRVQLPAGRRQTSERDLDGIVSFEARDVALLVECRTEVHLRGLHVLGIHALLLHLVEDRPRPGG